MDIETLIRQLGISREDVLELVELFIETARDDINKIRTCLAANDAQGVAMASHSIKGASSNLWLTEMAELTKKMEAEARDGNLTHFADYLSTLESQIALMESP